MIQRFPYNPEDVKLRMFLKKNDPASRPDGKFLAALEADIFAQIDRAPQVGVPSVWMLGKAFQPSWSSRVAALASVLVVLSGFAAGHVVSGVEPTRSYAGNLSLVALADETPVLATNVTWGENDDYAE